VRWIARHGGMALLNVHPDYMHFGDGRQGREEFPAGLYADFLQSVKDDYQDRFYHALPAQVAATYRAAAARSGMAAGGEPA
jgi:hypothetical protein